MDCQQISDICGWLGERWGFWIQTGALFLSAGIAIWVIRQNGRLARIRGTIDLVIQQKSNKDLGESLKTVYGLHEEKLPFSRFLTEAKSNEHRCILSVLNNQEFIAAGIRRKAFDETSYKRMQYSNMMKLWDSSSGIIFEMRNMTGNGTLFQEFEWLALRWKKDPLLKVDSAKWYQKLMRA